MPTKLQFKFREDATSEDREQVIAKLEQSGADKVEPLFPDASDQELATLYSAVVHDGGDADKVLRMLKNSKAIEFAEPAVERRLIR